MQVVARYVYCYSRPGGCPTVVSVYTYTKYSCARVHFSFLEQERKKKDTSACEIEKSFEARLYEPACDETIEASYS